jgi:hypothetical protein
MPQAEIQFIFNIFCLDFREESDFVINPMDEMMDMAEQNAHSPPSSLVPRLHAIVSYKLEHINPYLPRDLNNTASQQCKSTFIRTVRLQFLCRNQQQTE